MIDPHDGPVCELGRVSEGNSDTLRRRIEENTFTSLFYRRKSAVSRLRFQDTRWTSLYHHIKVCQDQIKEVDEMVFKTACSKVTEHTQEILCFSRILSELDVASSLAYLAQEKGYTRPEMTTR